MSHHRSAALLLVAVLALIVAACAGGGAPPDPSTVPSGDPSSDPGGSPAVGAIGHSTDAGTVILRYDEGGGFVPPAFTAANVPPFTLYGDGTAVFRDPAVEAPPMQGSVFVMNPLQTAKLSEEQIQEVLGFALGEGGLAAARPEYLNQMIADASTATFTIDTDDIKKTVAVYALGLDDPQGCADAPARAAFKRLADRLVGLGSGGAVVASDYVPTGYRASLFEAPGVVAPDVVAWPWEDVAPADFQPAADPNGFQFPFLDMTPEQVGALGVDGPEGGFQNLVITAPDGVTTYQLSARPLLPGEAE
jgi:hypothetical protein